MSELREKLVEAGGEQVGGQIIMRHPVTNKKLIAANCTGGEWEQTREWTAALKQAADEEVSEMDVAALAPEPEKEIVQDEASEPDENTTNTDET